MNQKLIYLETTVSGMFDVPLGHRITFRFIYLFTFNKEGGQARGRQYYNLRVFDIGQIHQLTDTMAKFHYKDIVETTIFTYAEKSMHLR